MCGFERQASSGLRHFPFEKILSPQIRGLAIAWIEYETTNGLKNSSVTQSGPNWFVVVKCTQACGIDFKPGECMRRQLQSRMLSVMFLTVLLPLLPATAFAASHREAPITALDHKADITDWFTFVSPEHPDRVVMILNADPLLEPSKGPNYFPFDPGVLYEMKVDNDHDGVEDVIFQFRFHTEIRLPGVFTGFVGGIAGIPPITALDGPGSEGLNLRQTYTVSTVKNGRHYDLTDGQTLFAVPTNVGPRTMPSYSELRQQGIYEIAQGVRVFAGTVADPFFIDLGAAFDSLHFRMAAGGGVLSPAKDADDHHNFAPNSLSGFNCNSIVLEVPITMLTRDGQLHPATDKDAVIGDIRYHLPSSTIDS